MALNEEVEGKSILRYGHTNAMIGRSRLDEAESLSRIRVFKGGAPGQMSRDLTVMAPSLKKALVRRSYSAFRGLAHARQTCDTNIIFADRHAHAYTTSTPGKIVALQPHRVSCFHLSGVFMATKSAEDTLVRTRSQWIQQNLKTTSEIQYTGFH